VTPSTLTVDGRPVPARYAPLWWHLRGLSQTASGYGRRLATPHLVQYGGRWRRVYCAVYSNAGTCYIDGPVDTATGRRSWLVVTD
jgi:hypothetical protein